MGVWKFIILFSSLLCMFKISHKKELLDKQKDGKVSSGKEKIVMLLS